MQEEANLENEEFRKIPSLDFLYEINSDGTIIRNVQSKRHLKIKTDYHHSSCGYKASFCNIKGTVTRVMIHKAVAECWLGQKPSGYEIDHINRDSQDNRYTNLRYVTRSVQMKNRVLSDRIIQQAKKNCAAWNAKIAIHVIIDGVEYDSICCAACYLSEKYNTSVEHIRSKLKKRRSNIYGHTIEYIEPSFAETRHDGL